MNRQEKEQAISDLRTRFEKASLTLLTDYCGLKVNNINQLRAQLKEVGAEMKVVKNTLAKLVLKDTGLEALESYFAGTVAVVTTGEDPVSPAKVLVKFIKDHEKPVLKIGYLSGDLMEPKSVEALSKLPGREELLSKLLGSMQAPAQNLVNVIAAIPRQLVTVLAAVRDTKA
ncbi:MAG: 50S ribosomal protein L10 [Deltaproteobacteria bacterium]|nr:50S ribosomal protein L10 [Deltaproteobacteria bacterium]